MPQGVKFNAIGNNIFRYLSGNCANVLHWFIMTVENEIEIATQGLMSLFHYVQWNYQPRLGVSTPVVLSGRKNNAFELESNTLAHKTKTDVLFINNQ